MNESETIAALVALAKTHPYAAAALGLWLVLSLGWKAQPKEKREAWGKTYPRPVSALRFALEILPDLLGAGRVLVYGLIRGQASREIVAPERETQAPPPPRESEPGYAESRVLAVIALASLVALALLTGCPMPAPDGCSPGARRCHEDTPQVCSPGQRWTPADVTCSTVNASCIVRDGVPACLRGEP